MHLVWTLHSIRDCCLPFWISSEEPNGHGQTLHAHDDADADVVVEEQEYADDQRPPTLLSYRLPNDLQQQRNKKNHLNKKTIYIYNNSFKKEKDKGKNCLSFLTTETDISFISRSLIGNRFVTGAATTWGVRDVIQ